VGVCVCGVCVCLTLFVWVRVWFLNGKVDVETGKERKTGY
jgi:hypothetical protein